MKIVISSGHGTRIRGASGYPIPPQLDEVDQAIRMLDTVAGYLISAGVDVVTFTDTTSTSQSQNLSAITNFHNKQGPHDWDVSIHFNAYDGTAHGTEVLYVTQEALASDIANAIANEGGFKLRGDNGAVYRGDLAFLNNTNEPAVLIETCFCDNTSDSNKYNDHYEDICRAIAEVLSGKTISDRPPIEPPGGETEPEPIPPGEPVTGEVHGLVAGDSLNIRAGASSTMTIIGKGQNGDLVTVVASQMNGDTKWYQIKVGDDHMAGIALYGWGSATYIEVDGEPPVAEDEWHSGITATEFGGSGDDQDSAYPDIDWINSSSRGVALPYKWSGDRPRVLVRGPGGEIECDIIDLGPWNTHDPNYCLGAARPLSETQYENGTEAQNGQVPSNPAGIDLTPPIADAVGISGKGIVSWRFA